MGSLGIVGLCSESYFKPLKNNKVYTTGLGSTLLKRPLGTDVPWVEIDDPVVDPGAVGIAQILLGNAHNPIRTRYQLRFFISRLLTTPGVCKLQTFDTTESK